MSRQSLLDRTGVKAVSANMFFVSGNTGAGPGTTAPVFGMRRSVRGYKLPSTATPDERLLAMASLTLSGRSTNGDVPHWQCFILTFTGLAFPEVITDIINGSDGEVSFLDFPADFLADLGAIENTLETDPTVGIRLHLPDLLPPSNEEMTTAVFNCADMLGCYGYYALVVHLMGKKITPPTRENITIRRPGNIIDGFHAQAEEYILRGGGRMSDHAHSSLNIAWDMLTSVKQVLVPRFAGLSRSTGIPGQIVYTMFDMLKNSGMQPAALIHQLVSALPWIDEIPILRPEYDFYVKSLMDYAQLPDLTRPFLKVMYGSSTRVFHAKSMANLTACAVMVLTTANPSLQGYTAPGGDAAKAILLAEIRARGVQLNLPGQVGSTGAAVATI